MTEESRETRVTPVNYYNKVIVPVTLYSFLLYYTYTYLLIRDAGGMSPILKRDVGEQIRQAKRLASAITGHPLEHDDQYHYHQSHHEIDDGNAYATSSSSRRSTVTGLEDEDDPGPPRRSWEGRTYVEVKGKGKGRASEEEEEVEEGVAMLGFDDGLGAKYTRGHGRRSLNEWFGDEVLTMSPGRWIDLRNLLLEVRPPFHKEVSVL